MRKNLGKLAIIVVAISASASTNADDRGRDRNHPETGFGKRLHIEALANDLARQSNSICWEMHRYYQNNPNFQADYKAMYEIREAADRIGKLARNGAYRTQRSDDKLAADLYSIDSLFDRIDADVRVWRANRRDNSRGRDMAALMDECEGTLDHFMDDYGIRSKIRHDHGRYGVHADRDHLPRR